MSSGRSLDIFRVLITFALLTPGYLAALDVACFRGAISLLFRASSSQHSIIFFIIFLSLLCITWPRRRVDLGCSIAKYKLWGGNVFVLVILSVIWGPQNAHRGHEIVISLPHFVPLRAINISCPYNTVSHVLSCFFAGREAEGVSGRTSVPHVLLPHVQHIGLFRIPIVSYGARSAMDKRMYRHPLTKQIMSYLSIPVTKH